jgi:tetratricopeptide (TPR) repeat protein
MNSSVRSTTHVVCNDWTRIVRPLSLIQYIRQNTQHNRASRHDKQHDVENDVIHIQGRRRVLHSALGALVVLGVSAGPSEALPKTQQNIRIEVADIDPSLAPDPLLYDATDVELRRAANMIQEGLNAESVQEEERIWTQIIQEFSESKAPWRDDVVGRAYGNRGNALSRQGYVDKALEDYNMAIKICPWSVDPVLNRGVLLENMLRFDEAVEDYKSVLKVAPQDPAAWNNLGNATAGLGQYDLAVKYYDKAVRLAPRFSFAAANKALSLYQSGGHDEEAIREMEALIRRYPDFSDMRAALAAAQWNSGKPGIAEENLERVDDIRYRDLKWLKQERRWPPRLVNEMEKLLTLSSTT